MTAIATAANINREELIDSYVTLMVDEMTLQEVKEMLCNMISDDLYELSAEQLIAEVNFAYPELLQVG
jgi:hypothetical protein